MSATNGNTGMLRESGEQILYLLLSILLRNRSIHLSEKGLPL